MPGIFQWRHDLDLLLSLPRSCGYQLRSFLEMIQAQGPQIVHCVAPVPPGSVNEDVLDLAMGLWQTAACLPTTCEAVDQHSQAFLKDLGYLCWQAKRLLILVAHLCHFQHPSRNEKNQKHMEGWSWWRTYPW